MAKPREIRDPIHGFINREPIEEKLIDTRVFQRLRGIKQLAMANLLYPGALHTRFEHSIGVMHVAGRIANHLKLKPKEVALIRLTALLHDIGHGPFSHVSEGILEKYFDKNKVKVDEREKIHELITCDIIDRSPELANSIPEDLRKDVKTLIQGNYPDPLIQSIISGPIDADKQDYLLRDSYFCGVKYGIFDLDRLINTLQKYKDQNKLKIGVTDDGVHAIEQFVLAKYYLSTQVYHHRVRHITDTMIIRAIELGIDVDKLGWLKDLYAYDRSEDYIKNYVDWDDNRLVTEILEAKNKKLYSYKYFIRLVERRLFKLIFSAKLDPSEFPNAHQLERLLKINPNKQKVIEEQIAEYLSKHFEAVAPYEIILNRFNYKSVRKSLKEKSDEEDERAIIVMVDKCPKEFKDVSTLFESIDDRRTEEWIEVYTPIENSKLANTRKKGKLTNEIKRIISEVVK